MKKNMVNLEDTEDKFNKFFILKYKFNKFFYT